MEKKKTLEGLVKENEKAMLDILKRLEDKTEVAVSGGSVTQSIMAYAKKRNKELPLITKLIQERGEVNRQEIRKRLGYKTWKKVVTLEDHKQKMFDEYEEIIGDTLAITDYDNVTSYCKRMDKELPSKLISYSKELYQYTKNVTLLKKEIEEFEQKDSINISEENEDIIFEKIKYIKRHEREIKHMRKKMQVISNFVEDMFRVKTPGKRRILVLEEDRNQVIQILFSRHSDLFSK